VAYVFFVMLCFVWGSSFILVERASHAFGPVAIGFGRLLGGTAVLALIWLLQRRPYRVTRRDLLQITFVTFVATAVPFVVLPYVVAHGFGHSFMGMMLSIVPLATILISIPMLGIWPTGRQLIGVVGGFVCLGIILQDGSARGMSVGLLALAASVPLTYSFGNTYIKWKLDHVPALPLTTLLLGIAGVMLLPVELIAPLRDYLDLTPPAQPTDWTQAVASLSFLGIVATGLSVLVFIHLVLKQGPLFAGMTTYVVPVLAMLWGSYDHETITRQQVVAMVGVLAMVALVQYGAAQPHPVAADAVAAPEVTHLGSAGAPAAGDGNCQPTNPASDAAHPEHVG
jgi:drug/metabolite transporter (DMT)-like permease